MKYASFRGMNILPELDPLRRKALKLWRKAVLSVYKPDTPDARFGEENIWLNAETAEYVYTRFTPLQINYIKGSRPFLEQTANEITKGCKTKREKVLAIVHWVRDIHKRSDGPMEIFHGGTEEEVIKKGSDMCNEMARVFCFLCQIKGIPARFAGHPMGSHGVAEAYLESGWAYFDDRGKYFVKPNGKFASIWDLMQNPSIITKQPAWVKKNLAKTSGIARTVDFYFHPREIQQIANYSIDNCAHYSYAWTWNTSALRKKIKNIKKDLFAAIKKVHSS